MALDSLDLSHFEYTLRQSQSIFVIFAFSDNFACPRTFVDSAPDVFHVHGSIGKSSNIEHELKLESQIYKPS